MTIEPAVVVRTEPLNAAERGSLWWAVPPLAVLAAANLLFELTGGGYGRVASAFLADRADAGGGDPAAASAAAINWATLALVHVCVSVAAAVGAWRVLNERVHGRARRPFTLFAAAVTLAGLAHLAVVDATGAPLSFLFTVTRDALRAAPEVSSVRITMVCAVVTLFNVTSPLVVALLTAAAAASALPPVAGWNEATLARRAVQIRRIVALAAAFMVGGVLHMGAWTHWAGATLAAPADVALDRVAAAVTIFWGAAFTLMIVGFYLPVASRLVRQADAIMTEAGIPVDARPKWLTERGLSFHWREQVPQIAAIAAPILAGPLSATLGGLAETVAR